MNLTDVTIISQKAEVDLSQEQAAAIASLEAQRDEIIASYNQDYYDGLYQDTLNYYANNFQMAAQLRNPSNSVNEASAITSGFSVFIDPDKADMRKVSNAELGLTKEREIRPEYTRRIPQERPFLIQMVDTEFQSYGIVLNNGTVVTALKLTPNPESLVLNSSKIINRYNTMTRWVEDHWGDEIDNMTFAGSTFSFFAYDVEGTPNTGLTIGYRNDTKPYLLLKEMAKLFRVNGLIYQDDKTYEGSDSQLAGYVSATDLFLNDESNRSFRLRHPRAGLVKERLYVNIWFDYVSVLGYFETFDITEDSSVPYRMNYNIVFKAEKTKYHQGRTATLRV